MNPAPIMLRPLLFIALPLLATATVAQPMVQSDFYQGAIRERGSRIIFCVWPTSPMVEFDRSVGREIAALQFLEPEFHDVQLASSGTQEMFEQELFIHLMDDCDAVMGASLTWEPLPEWLIVTEPYFEVTYLLAATEPGRGDAFSLPENARVGSVMLSRADMTLARTLAAGNRSDLSRIPYNTAENILRAIVAGDLDAGIIPSHALPLLGAQPSDGAIKATPLTVPPIEPEPVGMVLLSRDTYLRERLDEAIATLRSDGTLAALAGQHGFVSTD